VGHGIGLLGSQRHSVGDLAHGVSASWACVGFEIRAVGLCRRRTFAASNREIAERRFTGARPEVKICALSCSSAWRENRPVRR